MADEQRITHTPEEWRQFIEAQSSSGQEQGAFCEAHGLKRSTFQTWKRRLYGPQSRASDAGASSRALGPLFTRLTRPVDGAATPQAADWTVEIELGDGLCLRLRRGP